ncbi:MAG: TRAFs-binding domain-containing protein, partial [Rhizomicrobium sp.]
MTVSIQSIIAHARSGALDHAWRLFHEGGYDRARNDPAALCLRGRLLKDRAMREQGATRRALFLEAANAYARAGQISGETYPLINAATLSLLAGQKSKAASLARRVLSHGDDRNETPYYRAATRAEALLLVGKTAEASQALRDAMKRAPKAYEDHASTLRQFELILDEIAEDKSWLDALRPPRCLHFAGHMDARETSRKDIRQAVRDERVGFGYGALAAGADILIAEALLDAGAELHLVLPAPADAFREASVARYGKDWVKRFNRILKKAQSVRTIHSADGSLSPLAIQLAAEAAMGSAVMQAAALATEAVQLLILDRDGARNRAAGGSGWIAATWKKTGRRQHILIVPRRRKARPPVAAKADSVLAAMLRIELPAIAADRLARDTLPWLARALAAGVAPSIPARFTTDAVLVAYDTPQNAARAALSAA